MEFWGSLLIALIIVVVIIVVKKRKKASSEKQLNDVSASNFRSKHDKLEKINQYSYSSEELHKFAAKKFDRISDKKKNQYLSKRKIFLKSLYIPLGVVAFAISLLGVVLCILKNLNYLVLVVLFALIGAILLIIFAKNIKKPDEQLILTEIYYELKKIYSQMNESRISENKPYVKCHSKLYENITNLNSRYSFDRKICKQHYYSEELNSKRQFDNFDYNKWLMQQIDKNSQFYSSLENVYNVNLANYEKYSEEYALLKNFTEEIEVEDLDLDFETFNIIEKRLYSEEKQKVVMPPSVKVDYSYISPSGRNYYNSSYVFKYDELLKLINKKEELLRLKREESERKKQLLEDKNAKQQKLRELNKLEAKLSQREKQIEIKEQEFQKATQGHIYSADKAPLEKVVEVKKEHKTISEKMRDLKTAFDCGDISYEEYKIERQKILEEE